MASAFTKTEATTMNKYLNSTMQSCILLLHLTEHICEAQCSSGSTEAKQSSSILAKVGM